MFSNKKLKVEIITNKDEQLWDGAKVSSALLFSGGNFSGQSTISTETSLVFEDFKMDIDIKKVFSSVGPTASIRIYGVSQEHMNQITTIAMFRNIWISDKRVRISADNGNGYVTLFEGCITEAVPVYKSVPDCYIQIESSMAAFDNAKSLPPSSFSESEVAISFMCKTVCSQFGVNCYTAPELEKKVRPIVLNQKGLTARLAALCEAFNLTAIYTPSGYRIFEKGTGSGIIWNFTPTQMNGYPTYQKQSMKIDTDNFAEIEVSDLFRVSGSEIPYANGLWYITMIQYKLQSRTPNGQWQASLYGIPTMEK